MRYRIGGSLGNEDPSYVQRQADNQLYNALKRGEFCYVLNSRQMGKSSLLVKTQYRLQQEGCKCASIDMTNIGSETTTPQQWYKGIVADLWRGFQLREHVNLKQWWQAESELSLLQRLSRFIADVLLTTFPQEQLFIFIDEIDSILGLSFSIDDFFALIRFCYNQRAVDPEYNRLTFAIFGVATPADLIQDRQKTPFNIGTAIELEGFTLAEAQPLIAGIEKRVSNPEIILQEILAWTAGQPFLTQKICHILAGISQESSDGYLTIPPGREPFWIEALVLKHLIENWQSQDEPEHLRTIRDRLLYDEQRCSRLLGIYQQILQARTRKPENSVKETLPVEGRGKGTENQSLANKEITNKEITNKALSDAAGQLLNPVKVDDSREQIELLLSGLVVKKDGILAVKNRIYAAVFNLTWIDRQLSSLRPYFQVLAAWAASDRQDESRLLRGQALKDAQDWSQGKRLSDLDYQFLSASVEVDRRAVQLALEAERTQEIEARLVEEQKNARLQRSLLQTISLAFAIATTLALFSFWQYRQANESERKTRISEVQALISSSNGRFASHQPLDAMLDAIKAKQRLRGLSQVSSTMESQVDAVLQRAVYGAAEINRLSGHQAGIVTVTFSPDGKTLATTSVDKTVKLWRRDGGLLETLRGHETSVMTVAFSPNGRLLVSASDDGTLKFWQLDGTLLKTFKGHDAAVMTIVFSPDGQTLASSSVDKTLKLWRLDGTLIETFKGHEAGVPSVAFSPDGQTLASGSSDRTIKLWHLEGRLLKTFKGHEAGIWSVAFSPNGQTLASASADNTVKLWPLDGSPVKTLKGHEAGVWDVAFSPNGQTLASASADNTVKLWRQDGFLLKTFAGHDAVVTSVAFSPDGETLAAATENGSVRLWQQQNPFARIAIHHKAAVHSVAFSPNGQLLATASEDSTIQLWQPQQDQWIKTLTGHDAGIWAASFAPDGRTLATASTDNTVKLWQRDGTLIATLGGDGVAAWDVAFAPDGETVAIANEDGTVQLRQRDGTLLKTLKVHKSAVLAVAFAPKSSKIATASSDGTVNLWQRDGTLLKTLTQHGTVIWDVAFSADGKHLASAGQDGKVLLWSQDGTLRHTFTAHQAGAWSVAFSPDSSTLATASSDKTVKLWQLDGTLLETLTGHQSGVWSVVFSPDGNTLATASADKTVRLWNLEQVLNLDKLAFACNWVQNYLRTNATATEADRQLCDGVSP